MQKISGKLSIEFLWLTISLILTTFLAILLFGKSFPNNALDLHVHDTYFVVPKWPALTVLLLSVTFLLHLIKTRFKKLKTAFSYWIIIISGLILAISLTIVIKRLSQFESGGWTMYPPMSTLTPEMVSHEKSETLSAQIANFLIIIQFIILGITLVVSYRWGANKKQRNS